MDEPRWRVVIEANVPDSLWGLSELETDEQRVELLLEDVPAVLDGATWRVEPPWCDRRRDDGALCALYLGHKGHCDFGGDDD